MAPTCASSTGAVAEAEYLRAEVHRLWSIRRSLGGVRPCRGAGPGSATGQALLELAAATGRGRGRRSHAVSRASGNTFRWWLLRAQVEIGLATGTPQSAAAAAAASRAPADSSQRFRAWADHAEGSCTLPATTRWPPALCAGGRGLPLAPAWYDLAVAEAGLAVAHQRQGAADLARSTRSRTAGFRRLNVPPPDIIAPRARAPRSDRARGRGACPGRARCQQPGRRSRFGQRGHRQAASGEHLPQARGGLKDRRGPLGARPRPGPPGTDLAGLQFGHGRLPHHPVDVPTAGTDLASGDDERSVMTTQQLDQVAVEAFGDRMVGIMNDAAPP